MMQKRLQTVTGLCVAELNVLVCVYVCVCVGEITTTALLDREVKSEYILIVRAVDGGVGPLQKTGIATVTTDFDPLDRRPRMRNPRLLSLLDL